MLTSGHRRNSLPNLAELNPLRPESHYADMIARLNDARSVVVSVSIDKIDEIELTQKSCIIKNNLQVYTLLKYTLGDIGKSEEAIAKFNYLYEDGKNKSFIITLRRIDKELKDILSARNIFTKGNSYCFHNKNWLLNSITSNLYSGVPCAYKIFCHQLLHGLHFGDFLSQQNEVEHFYARYYERTNQ